MCQGRAALTGRAHAKPDKGANPDEVLNADWRVGGYPYRNLMRRSTYETQKYRLQVDLASLDKWDDYTRAKETMFFGTDTADAPWTVIKSDCKKRARLSAMRYVPHKLPYSTKDVDHIGKLDPLIVGRAHVVYEKGEKVGAIL